jgi:hypothetical protein
MPNGPDIPTSTPMYIRNRSNHFGLIKVLWIIIRCMPTLWPTSNEKYVRTIDVTNSSKLKVKGAMTKAVIIIPKFQNAFGKSRTTLPARAIELSPETRTTPSIIVTNIPIIFAILYTTISRELEF